MDARTQRSPEQWIAEHDEILINRTVNRIIQLFTNEEYGPFETTESFLMRIGTETKDYMLRQSRKQIMAAVQGEDG